MLEVQPYAGGTSLRLWDQHRWRLLVFAAFLELAHKVPFDRFSFLHVF